MQFSIGPREEGPPAATPASPIYLADFTMPHALLTAAVRQRVAQTFAELGISSEGEFRESLLIRGGAYCGRRFDAAKGHAIWFVEEDQIKFYGGDGRLAEVCEVEAPRALERMAA